MLFCDLVGSTALASHLDPEDLREVIGAYHRCVAETVTRFDGFVAKYMGDGVLVYFGYPQAHEDDAERAVQSGLAVVEAVGRLPAPEGPLQARLGIATGLVVVGDLIGAGAAQEQAVVGETPNLAARLQALAEPNTVVIGPTTRRLLGGLFECRDLGTVEVKGLPEPVHAFHVHRESAVESRFEALHGAGEMPLVGRDEEIKLLLDRWQRTKSGDGQILLLSGEPGIGKSRLIAAVQERLETEPHTRVRYFCSPHHTDSALHPVIAQLERAAGFMPEDTAETRLSKLTAVLAPAAPPQEEEALLAELLAIPSVDRYAPLDLTPQRKKEKTFEALLRQLEALARQRPVLMIFEDVHWIDPSSLELLDLTVGRVPRLPVLLLVTFRPEFQPPWAGPAHVTTTMLSRLGQAEGAALVARVAGDKALPAAIVGTIVERTDGVPLFLEELTKTVLESGLLREAAGRYELAGPLPPLAIPATLQGSLLARLDRLAPVREIAQIAAAIGREFAAPLVQVVAQRPAPAVDAALAQLVAAELIFPLGAPPATTYAFKHALVQEAAYATLLRERKRQLHARIATVLASEYPEVARTQPEVLARHYAAAGLTVEAIDHYRRAAGQAMAASANAEAIIHLTKGLELLWSLPPSPERDARELDFQIALGAPFIATRGWGAPEVEASYARARQLCEGMGDTPELFQSLVGLWLFHLLRARLDAALELSQQILGLAARLQNDDCLLEAHLITGCTHFWRGQPTAAVGHLKQVLALYSAERHRGHAVAYGQDPAVACHNHLALALWSLGFPDQALSQSRAAVSHAQDIEHAFSLGFALTFITYVHHMRRESEAAAEHARTLLTLAAEQGFMLLTLDASVYEGSVRSANGDALIDQIRSALAGVLAVGADLTHPLRATRLVFCLARAGRIDEGLEALAEALARIERTGERWWEAEVQRLMGDLLLQRHPNALDEAEGCYQRAIERARQQGAKSLELRAATSLAQLWRDQGKRVEARDLLAPVYGWFTEGFNTPDLQEAKALLNDLS